MQETMGFCCLFFLYLAVIPLLFIFAYHAFPTTILGIVGIIALCSFIPCMFNRGDTVVTEPVGPLLAATMLACTALVFLGSMYTYWAHVQPVRALLLAREYKGVYPSLPSIAFGDAAFVSFAGNTTVDVAKSVNVKTLDASLNTFCVAPVSNPATQSGRVEFWAVGVDCCGDSNSGKFECDDAGKSGARNAFVLQNPTDALFESIGKYIAPPLVRRDIFMQAIKKAERTKQLTTAEQPLLVRWTSLTKDEILRSEINKVVLQCFLNMAFSAVMSLILSRIVHRFGQLRKLHRMKQVGDAGEQMDVSARLTEFLTAFDDDSEDVQMMLSKRVSRPPLSKADMCIMGIIVPYLVMMLCVILTTYSSCTRNGHLIYAPFIIILGLYILALTATPNRVVNGLFLLLVSTTGLYIGYENYTTNMFHYCGVEARREYSNVASDASGDKYWDAGVLNFGAKSYLSQNHSVGFLYKETVYCAAPILSHGDDCVDTPVTAMLQNQNDAVNDAVPPLSFLQRTSRMHTSLDVDYDGMPHPPVVFHSTQCKATVPKRVEFWAIGTNCCSSRSDFRCDGAKDANAHAAVVVRATGTEEPGGHRDQFFNAISQAAAANDLPLPERPVLIRWGKDPKDLRQTWAKGAVGIILLTAMVSLLSILVVGIGSYFFLKRARRREKQEEDEEEKKGVDGDAFFSKARAGLREQLRV